ncbi:uncharacterized protein LOC123920483 isoform X1 [Trifolium pratense]|uniref:uncharacterized protein LOC123920483 isoform X1 n=1 Tax=Trifolium pratense TaxID=57577 RepID=UPI001E690A0E|nr:uncharacterized protein LOC123920483 isoform X1 [Trifolium pratense]
MGQSLEAFLQWKSLDSLLFGCTEAPFHKRTRLFTKDFFSLVLDGSVVDGDILKWLIFVGLSVLEGHFKRDSTCLYVSTINYLLVCKNTNFVSETWDHMRVLVPI